MNVQIVMLKPIGVWNIGEIASVPKEVAERWVFEKYAKYA